MSTLLISSNNDESRYEIPQSYINGEHRYSAGGWLESGNYTFSSGIQGASVAWEDNNVNVLSEGSAIRFKSDRQWQESSSPVLDLDEQIDISKSSSLKIHFAAPTNTSHVHLLLKDGNGAAIECAFSPNENATVPAALLSSFENGSQASINLSFVSSNLITTHSKLDELYIRSISTHRLGYYNLSEEQTMQLGTVTIMD